MPLKLSILILNMTNEFRVAEDSVDYFPVRLSANEKGYDRIAELTGRYLMNNIIQKK